MSQFRQGEGYVKVMSATAPTERQDGSSLEQQLITGYLFSMEYEDGLFIEDMPVQLINGKMSENIVIDDQEPGVYTITYKTTTANFLEGGPASVPYILDILPPFAPPNPPNGIS
jgi:hypothetical protein